MKYWTPESIASARRWNNRGTGSMAEKTRQFGFALDEIERLQDEIEELYKEVAGVPL